MNDEHRRCLHEHGYTLPEVRPPAFNYVNSVAVGNLVYMSGKIPGDDSVTGQLGNDVELAQGREAAVSAALKLLATADEEYGLENVARVVKVNGYVASAPTFHGQAQIVDAASAVFRSILGEVGQHARTSIGVSSLPGNASVEIEAILELHTTVVSP